MTTYTRDDYKTFFEDLREVHEKTVTANVALQKRVEELEAALTKAQKDINWMCNEGKVLNRFVFNYLDEAINK